MIYKFRKPQEEEYVTEFFLPDKCLVDKLSRTKTLAEYRANGYVCAGFVSVDKETYLNARLNETVKDYCANEDFRQDVQEKFNQCSITSKVYIDTMRLIDDFKWTCLSKLDRQVRRIVNEDFCIQNEVAVQIYDALHGLNSVRV